jgi:hypothetical protein
MEVQRVEMPAKARGRLSELVPIAGTESWRR